MIIDVKLPQFSTAGWAIIGAGALVASGILLAAFSQPLQTNRGGRRARRFRNWGEK